MKLLPYTIFTATGASGGNLSRDTKLGSQIFQFFAKSVLGDHTDFVLHLELASIESAAIEKTTDTYKIYLEILSLDEDKIKLISSRLEPLLISLAQLVTMKLKSYNEQLIAQIDAKMNNLVR
ncbi:hypothetical protein G6F46_003247 [Rhizopus delemar]|uniref:Uncharacterized protein n=2 Tax=Rhizopus TaxID=4842 RepID=A0A9P6YZB3_9FUNG|nr:hypothetical protein G6F43_009090 [Rhizopus delemar]KAG1540341.1 hypothetical protein G6F51_008582 [Rhizopus arrhizus]KAG1454460.1 hypothetical protein G6F55_007598 [Rhizopus delemar]KAG1501982.1 hypothetical protein G6F54_002665 [Rhizopus delemar]KAG1508650.1 hypothetical protein G6F53_008036 [Rhizopus delemar]